MNHPTDEYCNNNRQYEDRGSNSRIKTADSLQFGVVHLFVILRDFRHVAEVAELIVELSDVYHHSAKRLASHILLDTNPPSFCLPA